MKTPTSSKHFTLTDSNGVAKEGEGGRHIDRGDTVSDSVSLSSEESCLSTDVHRPAVRSFHIPQINGEVSLRV